VGRERVQTRHGRGEVGDERRGLAQERAHVVAQRDGACGANGVSVWSAAGRRCTAGSSASSVGRASPERLQVGQRRARHGRAWPGASPAMRAARRPAGDGVQRLIAGGDDAASRWSCEAARVTTATSCTSRASDVAGRPARGRSARPAPWSARSRERAADVRARGRACPDRRRDQRGEERARVAVERASRSESGTGRSCARCRSSRRRGAVAPAGPG